MKYLLLLPLLILIPHSAFASISFVASTTASGTGTNITAVEPTGTALNDVLVNVFQVNSVSAVVKLPAGWSWLHYGTSTNSRYEIIVGYIRRGASAPDLTFLNDTSAYRMISLLTFRGVITSGSPIDSQSALGSFYFGSTLPDPSATTAVSTRAMAITYGADFNGAISKAPANYVEAARNDEHDIGYRLLSVSGSENPGTFTAPASNDDRWNGGTFTLTPAPPMIAPRLVLWSPMVINSPLRIN